MNNKYVAPNRAVTGWYWICDFCNKPTRNPIFINGVIEDNFGSIRNLICCPNCVPKEGESLMIEVERDSEYNPEEFEDSGFDPKEYIGKIKDCYKEWNDENGRRDGGQKGGK